MINSGNYITTFMLTRSSETILKILNIKLRSTMARLILEIDSEHKNKKTGFYPNSLRPFLRILCVVDDSIYAC